MVDRGEAGRRSPTPQHALEQQRRRHRAAGTGLAIGGGVLIIVTWLERYSGPLIDDPGGSLVTSGAILIHIASFVTFILIAYGIPTIAAIQPGAGRRVRIGARVMGFGFYLGVVPHTVLDFTAIPMLFDTLPAKQAVEFTNRMYAIIGPLAMVGILSLVVSLIVVSLATRRAGVLPRWAWMTGLLALPGAIVLLILQTAFPDLPIPHMPIAFDSALVAYGLGVRSVASATAPLPAAVAPAVPA